MRVIILTLLVLLSGCSVFERKPETPIVVQPKCLGKKPVKPQYGFELLTPRETEAEAIEAVRQLMLDFRAADQYGLDWETAASGCQ